MKGFLVPWGFSGSVEVMNPMRNMRVLLGVAALLSIGGVGCRTASHSARAVESQAIVGAAVTGVQPPSPSTPEACRACDGLWARQGIAQVQGCNCRARDAGRACRDGAECEGQCLLGDPPEQARVSGADSGGGAGTGYFVGHCSDRVTVFGCVRLLPRGFSSGGPIALNAPPPMLCID